jgi:TolB protein
MFGELSLTGARAYVARPGVRLEQHTFVEEGADLDVAIDPRAGRIALSSTRHHEQADLYLKSIDGVALTQLTSDLAADVQPTFSPDGRRIAFASNRAGDWDIWVLDIAQGDVVQVTSGPADDIHPSWSPDGALLAYCSLGRSGQWELWVSDAKSASSRKYIGDGLFPEWSPAGDVILFQRARQRGSQWFSIWTLPLRDGEPGYSTELASSSSQALILPTWSPDGKRVAFVALDPDRNDGASVSWDDARSDVWVMDADGQRRVRVTDGVRRNTHPAFAPDGRVFFISDRSGVECVWSTAIAVDRDGGVLPAEHMTEDAWEPSTPARRPSMGDEVIPPRAGP